MGRVGDDCSGTGATTSVNDTGDQFVFEVEIDDWMGYRNVIGLIRTEDHHVCPATPPRDCSIVHSIVFPIEVMWIRKLKNDCPPCIALTDEDVQRAGSVHFLYCIFELRC